MVKLLLLIVVLLVVVMMVMIVAWNIFDPIYRSWNNHGYGRILCDSDTYSTTKGLSSSVAPS